MDKSFALDDIGIQINFAQAPIMKNDIDQITDFFSLYKVFAWEKDVNSMIGLYDQNVVIFDMWEKLNTTGLTAWSGVIRQWLSSLSDERVNVIFEMIETTVGQEVSFASAIIQYQAIATDESVIRSMRNRITLGFVRTKSVWKVVHQHTSAPIDSKLQAILTD